MAYKSIMTRESRPRSGIALGGIGAGWFELRHDGLFYDWNIFNNRPLGLGKHFKMDNQSMLFFIIRFREQGKEPRLRLLQIEKKLGSAAIRGHEHYYIFPWLSGVDKIEYEAVFPFANMKFADMDMPLSVEMEAYSHFIPHDVKNSSLPAAMFNFKITSKTKKPIDVMVLASMRNGVGYDIEERTYASSIISRKGYKMFEMTCNGVPKNHSPYGTMGVASFNPKSSYYLGWEHHHPYYELLIRNKKLVNIDDTKGRNPINKKTGKPQAQEFMLCSIGMSKKLNKKNDSLNHTFAAVWNFPNNYAQSPILGPNWKALKDKHIEGHYYSNFFKTSADAADYIYRRKNELYAGTKKFRDSFYDSSLDEFILDQVNSHLNTFFTSSWLTKAGHFGIIEGLNAYQSFAGLSTTDVAMYGSISAAALFPELDKDIWLEHTKFQAPKGTVAHSISRNFRKLPKGETDGKRIDLPAQYVFQSLRYFFWSGDRAYLKKIWPHVKKALDYILRERDMNKDMLPDMEGIMCSYDNFAMYGISSYVSSQWLAAVKTAIEAARVMNDKQAEEKYSRVFEKGLGVFEKRLWNRKYYRLYDNTDAKKGDKDDACLADQLLGQWCAHHIGLGHLFDKKRIRKALQNILRINYKKGQGLRNCQWHGDKFLHDTDKDTWVDQANTCWTGVELAFASFLLYEGMRKETYEIIRNVDERHRHWGIYWDHQEFGGRYFRPMSSWGIINAALGLAIRNKEYWFTPKIPGKNIKLFFSFFHGTAHYCRSISAKQKKINIYILSGVFSAKKINLKIFNNTARNIVVKINYTIISRKGYSITCSGREIEVAFQKELRLKSGNDIQVSFN